VSTNGWTLQIVHVLLIHIEALQCPLRGKEDFFALASGVKDVAGHTE
jgi:hypothetical protein